MVCGKGFTTLKRHLAAAHDMTPKEYRTQFDIPAGTTLAAKDYSESRRQMAIDKNLGAGLAAARAKRVKKK
jgi:predicted transcriptional regulator